MVRLFLAAAVLAHLQDLAYGQEAPAPAPAPPPPPPPPPTELDCHERDEAQCAETAFCVHTGEGCYVAPTCAVAEPYDGSGEPFSCQGVVNGADSNPSQIICESYGCSAAECCTAEPGSCGDFDCGGSGMVSRYPISCHPVHGCSAEYCCVPHYANLTSCHMFDCTDDESIRRSNEDECNGEGQPPCDSTTCCDPVGEELLLQDEYCRLAPPFGNAGEQCGAGLTCNPYTFPPVCTVLPETEGYPCEFDHAGCGEQSGTGLRCQEDFNSNWRCMPSSACSAAESGTACAAPTDGTPAEGEITSANANVWFVFDAEGGQTYQLDTQLSGTLSDSVLDLVNSDGSEVLANNDDCDGPESTLASCIEWTAPVTGTYYAMVRAYDGEGDTGTFTLTINQFRRHEAGEVQLPYGCSVTPDASGRVDFPDGFQPGANLTLAGCRVRDEYVNGEEAALLHSICEAVEGEDWQCYDTRYTTPMGYEMYPCTYDYASGCMIDADAGTITGSVEIRAVHNMTSLHLNGLLAIDGELQIEGCRLLAEIDFGALANVTGVSMKELPNVTNLEWPALMHVSGELQIERMEALTSISLPSLVSVGDDLQLFELTSLTSISLPSLVSVGDDLQLFELTSLTSISFPSLVSVGDKVEIGFAPALASFVAPELHSVHFVGFMSTRMYGAPEAMCNASCEAQQTAGCSLRSEELFWHMYNQNSHIWTEPPTAETFDAMCANTTCADHNGFPFGTYQDGEERCRLQTNRSSCFDTPFCDSEDDTFMCIATSWSHSQGCPIELPASTVVGVRRIFGEEPLPLPPYPRDLLCRQPRDLRGYLRPMEEDLNRSSFNVSTACAYGHRGKAVVSACAHPGGEYRLDGCNAVPSCSAARTCTAATTSAHVRCDAEGSRCGALPVELAEAYTLSGSSDVRTHPFVHSFFRSRAIVVLCCLVGRHRRTRSRVHP